MITKSLHKPNTYYLFRDDNTELEFEKRKGVPPKIKGDYKFRSEDKEAINNYFKLNSNERP